VCFIVHRTTSEQERVIFTILYLAGGKTPTIDTLVRGICSVLFESASRPLIDFGD
jgi:hypothetical protein